jgi:hypothetical protein
MARKKTEKKTPAIERKPEPRRGSPKKETKTEPKASDIRIELTQEQLKCDLTLEELEKIADRSAHVTGEIENKRGAMKSAQSSMASEIKLLESNLSSLATKRRDKCEYRMVECQEVFDYRNNEVRVVRLDTSEKVRSRPMTGSEREMELRLADGQTVKESTKPKKPMEVEQVHSSSGNDADVTKPDDGSIDDTYQNANEDNSQELDY